MSTLTQEQLQHLAKLTSLKISDEQMQDLLPQMDGILKFVGQLQELDLQPCDAIQEDGLSQTREGVGNPMSREGFLSNIQHPITDGKLTIQTSTNQ